ncbi:hypothetical protein [Pseudomonas sp. PS01300]|uniref:hypothetical protein n=1 Tax=Pseudomonas sp. PS01300 TaxID=2991436 RepID=UPI002499E8D5|nr:hypothetical protein [Pseudomonas sp. PS01300]
MPTENRSSNSEMVSFPRELSDDLAELIAARARVCGGGAFEIWEEICNGFGKPAEPHQGEPVAYADPRSFENLKSFGRLGGIYLHEWMWAEPGPGMVPLYTRPAQGEPVALPKRLPVRMPEGRNLPKGYAEAWNACLAEVEKLGPLYTHADTGEVERLREELASAVADKEAYAQNAIDLRRRVENADLALKVQTQNCDALRAQLAALLAAVSKHREALKPLGLPLGDSLEEAALSASAEPSEECAHSYANKLGCPECGEASSGAESSGPVECGPWQPLTAPGQIQEGDWLSFTVSGSLICAQTRLVIDPGTAREEIVYNRQKNHYFVTSMAVDGTSTHKGVLVAKAKS